MTAAAIFYSISVLQRYLKDVLTLDNQQVGCALMIFNIKVFRAQTCL